MFVCVFILAPYYIAWAAAFGYLQKRAMNSSAKAARRLAQTTNAVVGATKAVGTGVVDVTKKAGSVTAGAAKKLVRSSKVKYCVCVCVCVLNSKQTIKKKIKIK